MFSPDNGSLWLAEQPLLARRGLLSCTDSKADGRHIPWKSRGDSPLDDFWIGTVPHLHSLHSLLVQSRLSTVNRVAVQLLCIYIVPSLRGSQSVSKY